MEEFQELHTSCSLLVINELKIHTFLINKYRYTEFADHTLVK